MRHYILLLTVICSAAALEFPKMGNQMMYPRNAVINSSDTSTSAKRSIGNIIERRKELHERRMARIEREKEEARLKERGLWDWITDDVLGISWNCYVVGYPKWNDGCAATSGIRSPNGISSSETSWVNKRKTQGLAAFQKWLKNMAITGMPAGSISNFPKVGVAFSGGGLRAMLSGAGVFDGLDSRSTIATPNVNSGKATVNGLLDFTTYITGLSGGSWLVTASAQNNFATIDWVRKNIWDSPSLLPDLYDFGFSYANMATDFAKRTANFPDLTSLTDLWGWLIGYGLISKGLSPAKTLFTDIVTTTNFAAASMPFPIVVMDQAKGGSLVNAQDVNVPILEANPYEFGDWNSTRGFINAKMMGTTFTNNGASTYQCMQNFQLTQWLAGASACVFPGAYPNIEAAQGSIKGFIKNLYSSVWGQIAIGLLQVAMPTIQTLIRDIDNIDLPSFYQSLSDKGMLTANLYNPWDYVRNGKPASGSFADPDGPILRLDDGGMDKQNVPVVPLLYRGVDVIIANDNSGDTSTNWPNGTSLYTTMQWAQTRGIAFPTVPSPTEIIAKGWTQKPMFYGCNATTGPLIIYIPAAPGIKGANGVVNIDTLTFTVDYDAVPTFISNGNANILRQSGTPAASSVPSNWAQCVACAVMDRQLKKAGTTRPAVCQTCFNSLCYS